MLGVVSGATGDLAGSANGGGRPIRSAGDGESAAFGSSALADAAGLGLPALAGVVARAQDGIAVVDGERRFVYANPAACEMLGYSLAQLRGRDFLGCVAAREHSIILARFTSIDRPSSCSA